MMFDVAVIGGGIVGLSSAMHVLERLPDAKVIVIEKEDRVAAHQTGHNSGVIHSGIYYPPGSYKARFATAGSRSIVEFCERHGIEHDVCGKVIVATRSDELPQLERLYERGLQNGLDVSRLTPTEAREIEPHVAAVAAVKVPSTGIVDYTRVCEVYATEIAARGGEIRFGTRVTRLTQNARGAVIDTTAGTVEARFVVNCAGLYSDRVARMDGADPTAQIVPFRGEYYELAPERRHLVKGLIYPVPDPAFPFLGVHLTRMIDGSIHAGPNAVLGLRREGYRKRDIHLGELAEILRYRGFWRLVGKHWRDGMHEVWRSVNRAAFLKSLQRLIPELTDADIVPTHAGVRAQAVKPDGGMVDDFLLVDMPRSLHVCNAPSPAATASLEIGREIAERVAARAGELGIASGTATAFERMSS
jgi:(S)-2-hydroxyglutarate dehydrogenase